MSRRISSRTWARRPSDRTAACSETSAVTAASRSSSLGARRSPQRDAAPPGAVEGRRPAPPRAGRRPSCRVNPACPAPRPGERSYARAASLAPVAVIEVRQADITKLEVDAIANAANTELRHGGGVAGAIVRAGGRASRTRATARPVEIGEAVATGAGELPPKWVIHAATMQLGGPTSAEVIRSATAAPSRRRRARRPLPGLVAFGTGVGGFPIGDAARIEVEEVRGTSSGHRPGADRLRRLRSRRPRAFDAEMARQG